MNYSNYLNAKYEECTKSSCNSKYPKSTYIDKCARRIKDDCIWFWSNHLFVCVKIQIQRRSEKCVVWKFDFFFEVLICLFVSLIEWLKIRMFECVLIAISKTSSTHSHSYLFINLFRWKIFLRVKSFWWHFPFLIRLWFVFGRRAVMSPVHG